MRLNSSLGRRNKGFIPSSLLASHRKLRPRRNQSYKYPQLYQYNNVKFRLYNAIQQTWAKQIDKIPILLTEEDIKNWLTFRTDKLKFNQLYIWHATKFDWIPLWANENEFILPDHNSIQYDKVNYTQFTKANWITQNSVSPEAIKKLMNKFDIPSYTIDQMQPVINSVIQDGQVAASGQPYFINFYDQSDNQIRFYNHHRRGWNSNKWFDNRDNRYNFQFIKEFRQVFNFSNNPSNASQVKSIREAMENAPNGTYMYQEKGTYIPYRINQGHVTFNRGDAIEVKQIRNGLSQNRCINTNTYNKLNFRQYQLLYEIRHSIFIDSKDGTYRMEFLLNYSRTIPKGDWFNASFDKLFHNQNDLCTFMLLDQSGIYGVPIGINKYSKSVILNDNTWYTWSEFKVKFNKNEIERYQNLDFKGNETLLNNEYINNNYKPPCQQIAMVDIDKLSKSNILSHFIGQFVLLDFGYDSYLPIYIYSPTLIRSNQHIIVLSDIKKYIEHVPTALIHKDHINNTQNYVTITTTSCALMNNWKSYAVNQRPNLDIIPISNINGQLTEQEASIVNNAMDNAINHISDRQQFRANGNSRSANNSPIIQPQQPNENGNNIQIIPLLNVSQLPINKPKPVEAYNHVDVDEMMLLLPSDRLKILFNKIYIRIQPYCPGDRDEVTTCIMNLDHEQIVGALNNEDLLFSIIQEIIPLFKEMKKKNRNIQSSTSIWDSRIRDFDTGVLKMVNQSCIVKEVNQIKDSFRKRSYLKGIIAGHIRRIDFSRVNQLMKYIQGYSNEDLIKLGSNVKLLIDAIMTAQNQLHQETRISCLEILKDIIKNNVNNQFGMNQNQSQNDSNIPQVNDSQSNASQPQQSQPQPQPQPQSQSQSQSQIQNQSQHLLYPPNGINGIDGGENKDDKKEDSMMGSQQPSQLNNNFNANLRKLNSNKHNNDSDGDSNASHRLVELTKEMEGKLLQSWHDFDYSHLRTFQYENPCFSTKTELYDNSAQTTTEMDSDPQFNLKDMVIHVAQHAKNDPNDFIRLRFSSSSIEKKNGNVDFMLKLGAFIKETGGIWEFVHKIDIVQINYRKNDFDYAMENDQRQYDADIREWEILHKKVGKNWNRPDHPGPQPTFKNPNELSLCDKIIDRSNSTYHISTDDGESKPIRRGIIQWDSNVQFQNCVDFYFLNTAAFAQQDDWEERMKTQFYDWQRQRQNMVINEDGVVMAKDTIFEIFKPTNNCTIRINIPMSELDDCGNPVKLHKQVKKILKYHNYMEKRKNGKNIFPIDCIKTITRSKKSKDIVDKVINRWENWKFNNRNRYNKMSQETKLLIQEKRVLEQIFSNNIYIEFNKWVDNIPKEIDYALDKWMVELVSSKDSILEKRLRALKQCDSCGDIKCRKNRCRNFKKTVNMLALKYNVNKETAKKWMGRFCDNCGQTGGHRGKCERYCKFCGSTTHNSQVSPLCPYWNGWAILTLLYNDNYVRNLIVRNDYKKNTTRLDTYWIIDISLEIEKTDNNSNVYDKIVRQVEIMKYLCDICDFNCVEGENVRLIDKLHDAWMDETQTQIQNDNNNENENVNQNENENKNENKNENENKDDNDNVELGIMVDENQENGKSKNKPRYRKRGKRKQDKEKNMGNGECFNCETNIDYIKRYKQCKCSYIYCSKCWDEVFMEDDEIECYGCQGVTNGQMNIIVNSKALEQSDVESDIDWENEVIVSDDEKNDSEEDDVNIQTSNDNNNNNNNNNNNGNNNNHNLDYSQVKYEVNRRNKFNKNKFRKSKQNNNFSKNARNRKFKIIKNKNKNKKS